MTRISSEQMNEINKQARDAIKKAGGEAPRSLRSAIAKALKEGGVTVGNPRKRKARKARKASKPRKRSR